MTLDDLSRQLECCLSAENYEKAETIIQQIKEHNTYKTCNYINTGIIKREVKEAELMIEQHK